MREVIVRLHRFAELSEQAHARAVEIIRERLRSDGWDITSIDHVEAAMVHALASALHSPGRDQYDEAEDFPGISRVQLTGWDLNRDHSIEVTGTLTRHNAPALPWAGGIDHAELTGHRSDATTIEVVDTEPNCTCPPGQYLAPHEQACPWLVPSPVTDDQRERLEEAVRDALRHAWSAGNSEAEYLTSEERALIVATDYEFTEAGALPISRTIPLPIPPTSTP